MAGGIDWFRWHHGSVSDQKFGLVAKKASASVAEVIAVWACLLEAASAAEDRGNPGLPDFEAMDFALGIDEGKSRRIYERLRERSMLDAETGRIAAWEKRQPKRERPDDNSTERSRAHRERKSEPRNATQRHATPEMAEKHQETPRGEKSREEKKDKDIPPDGFIAFWSAYPNHRAKQDALKAWSKLKPNAELQSSILKAIAMQSQGEDWRKEGGRFVPHAATWLNGERWQDEARLFSAESAGMDV